MTVTPLRRACTAVLLALLLAGFLPSTAIPASAAPLLQIPVAGLGTPYAQNFDTLAATGTNITWTDNTTLPGWYSTRLTYNAGNGGVGSGTLYSFGATSATERALGSVASGSTDTIYYGARLKNNTAAVITSLDVAYTGEQWRNGGNTAQHKLEFSYQISPTVTSLTAGTWLDADSLDFTGPITGATAIALDGNAPANRVAISASISVTIAPGAEIMLRWMDINDGGNDHGLAADDLSVVAQGSIVSETAPSVASTVPATGTVDVAIDANVTVNFSEPVNVVDPWFTLVCATSGAHTAAVSGGPISFTLDPAADFAFSESCTLTVLAAQVTDQDGDDPPDDMAADYAATFTTAADVCQLTFTPAYAIQGNGPSAAITGTVTTQGVVVGDFETPGGSGQLRGFFLQDLAGDGDPATSDGIFVFNGGTDSVSLGEIVRVTGTAGDFQDQTQVSASAIADCGTGSVAPADVTFPVSSTTFLERFEGMLVRLPQTMHVTEHFQLGRFGQVVLSAEARLQQPTNVVAPGAPALALQAQNNLNRIILDDATNTQNPDPIVFGRGGQPLSAGNTLRGGDTATGIVGVMSYTWAGAGGNAYRVRPVNALGGFVNFEPANPRPDAAPAVGGSLKVASMNLLNYFNTFDGLPDTVDNCTFGVGGAPADCRGADTQEEFDRQWPKTVAAILALNPDVLGVNEVENDGYDAASAIQHLVDSLNATAGAGTYALIDADAATGQVNALGTDAIKVGMIYKPGVVTPVGQTGALNSIAFVNGGDGAPRSRPALAQAFAQNATGARVIVVANHFKSKGSACDAPDAGDGQGNCNAVRVNAATELVNWLATDPTGTGDPDILLMGDYNSYALEDPITVIKNAGYTNLVAQFLGPDAYSYVFDGQWGYLDYALASAPAVAQVTGVGDYRINADEPSVLDYNTDFKSPGQIVSLYAPDKFRVSDHNPVLVGLNLTTLPPTADAGGPHAANEGDSVALAATGSDPEGLPVTFAWDLDDNGIFETAGQTATFSAVDNGVFTVTVQVTDAGGQTATDATTVAVANVPPSVGAIVAPSAPITAGTPISVSAAFTDPGVLDTHSAEWNWGDGSTSAGVVSESNGSGSVAGSHTYAAPGAYTVTLTVTDDDGGVGTATRQVTVVAEPEEKYPIYLPIIANDGM